MAEALESHQLHLEQILNNSPDGVFTISPENTICYVNPAFCRILGFEAEELMGTQIHQYLGDLSIFEACNKEVQKHGYCHDQETIFKRKDGSMVHISKNVQAICDDEGRLKEVLVTIRDLSDLHHLNRELTESQAELEAKNNDLERMLAELRNTQKQLVEAEKMASLGGLVAGISHEINTPLGISVTSASTMHRELHDLRDKFENSQLKKTELDDFFSQASQACQILNTNLRRAAELVRSFKQVAVDQTNDDLRDINLSDYRNEILVSIGPSYKHKPITLNTECDQDIYLKTYPGALSQIISNLVINSITHAYDEGEPGNIHINISANDDNVIFEYSDDGKGIHRDNLGNIFTPFYTTRRGKGGTGLGLSIVYNLVSATLMGSIDVESSVGEGTRFHIVFPRQSVN